MHNSIINILVLKYYRYVEEKGVRINKTHNFVRFLRKFKNRFFMSWLRKEKLLFKLLQPFYHWRVDFRRFYIKGAVFRSKQETKRKLKQEKAAAKANKKKKKYIFIKDRGDQGKVLDEKEDSNERLRFIKFKKASKVLYRRSRRSM